MTCLAIFLANHSWWYELTQYMLNGPDALTAVAVCWPVLLLSDHPNKAQSL